MKFREHLNTLEEARDKSVPTEWRIGLGNAQRFYGDKNNSNVSKEEFDADMERIAKQLKIKEVSDFVRWMETQMSFTMEPGVRIRESEEVNESIEYGEVMSFLNELFKTAKDKEKTKEIQLYISKNLK